MGIGSCARPATCVAVRSSAVQSVAQPSVRARTFLTRDSVSATKTATSFAVDYAIPIGRDAGQLGRDAWGSRLAGSLTVVRHRPGHRAEPDPKSTLANAAYLGLIRGLSPIGPIADGDTCSPVLDCALRPLAIGGPVP